MKTLLVIFTLISSAYEIEPYLEKNIATIPSKPLYKRIEHITLQDKNKDIRINLRFKNSDEKPLKAVVLRYSVSFILKKDTSTIETVSVLSSHLRESEIKPNQTKSLYIYNIKNLLNELRRFINAGYTPVGLKLKLMKEPKKNEEIFIKEVIFEIKEN